jgi:hypothetical protein
MKAGLRTLMMPLALTVSSSFFAATGDALVPPEPSSYADRMTELLRPVKASPTPLGGRSALTVSASGAQSELVGLRKGGVVRERFLEPLNEPQLEKLGLARSLIKEPMKIWKLFDPTAPSSRTGYWEYYWSCRYPTYGMPPYCQRDPIWCMPVGFNMGGWYW